MTAAFPGHGHGCFETDAAGEEPRFVSIFHWRLASRGTPGTRAKGLNRIDPNFLLALRGVCRYHSEKHR
jgi:hypothetical protein